MSRAGIAAAFACCLFLAACGTAGERAAPAPQGLVVDAMAFNIRYGTADDGDDSWPHREQLVYDVIRRRDADFVGLQEALRFQLDGIREAVAGYGELGIGRDGGDGEYSAARGNDEPVIVTGDFNAGEDNAAIRHLVNADGVSPVALRDTYRVRHPDAADAGTFNGFEGRRDGPKIDYVFVGPRARVLAAGILRRHRDGRYPSDHFPVHARIALPVLR